MATPDTLSSSALWSKRRRMIREALIAYAFVAPATIITLVFAIYPVMLAAWRSLLWGSPRPKVYYGLNHYVSAMGSLAYFLVFLLAFVFCFVAYQAWLRLRKEYQKYPSDHAWIFLFPGLAAAAGTISALIIVIPLGLAWEHLWVCVAMLVVGLIGYIGLSNNPLRKGNASIYVLNSWLLMQLTLAAVLLAIYTYNQIEERTEGAREVARLLFNYDISNANPQVPASEPRLVNVTIAENAPVELEIDDEPYTAFLAYQTVPLDINQINNGVDYSSIAGYTISLRAQDSVQVYFPLSRGLGLPDVQYFYTTKPNEIQLDSGAPSNDLFGNNTDTQAADTIEVPIVLNPGSSITTRQDIYFTNDVGLKLIDRQAYTMPATQPLNASLAIIIGISAIYFIGQLRLSFDATVNQETFTPTEARIYMLLGWVRLLVGIAVVGLFLYLISAIQLYRSAAHGMEILALDQQRPFELAYFQATGEYPRRIRASNLAADLYFLPQLITMAIGAFFICLAYVIWTGAKDRQTNRGFVGSLLLAISLMVGGWLAIGEFPQIISVAGTNAQEARDSLIRTAIYSFGSVPIQLTLGLTLAYFLFYEIKRGKGMYRLVYFLPYIAPQVATATVFQVIFNAREKSLANQALTAAGTDPLRWLLEDNGVFQVIFEILGGNPNHIPAAFEGPSLALTTVIIFNIWVYSGYNAVIFLAGLGSVPGELYEAAKVDGAGRWAAFRAITMPLLSPVTFFLAMLGIIGSFRSFSSIYVLKNPGVNSVNTLSVEIFETYYGEGNTGYAASLAFILFGVILVLTIVQNQIARKQVFYG